MQNDFERKVSVLRGLLRAIEEEAAEAADEAKALAEADAFIDEVDDGTSLEDGELKDALAFGERMRMLAATEQLRSPVQRRVLGHARYFSEAQLWSALESDDEATRAASFAATEVLADLASLRARAGGSNFLAERRDIFDTKRLLADVRSRQREMSEAAERVFDTVMPLRARIAAGDMSATEDVRARARELIERIRTRVDELDGCDETQEKLP